MMSSPRLHAVSASLAAILLLFVPVTFLRAADDDAAARHATAEEVLASNNTKAALDITSNQLTQSMEKFAERMEKQPGLTPEGMAEIKKFRDESRALITQQLNWDAIKGDVVQAYADTFTEDELKAILAFHQTPVGQKLAAKEPELAEKLNKALQQRAMSLVPTIQQKIVAVNRKIRPVPSPAAPVVVKPGESPLPPAAGPAVPPVMVPVTSLPASSPVVHPDATPAVAPAAMPSPAPSATPAR